MATIVPIAAAIDAYAARRSAKEIALAIGFDEKSSEEIALAISELASNLVKYARGGKLTLAQIQEDQRRGIQVESTDFGPGIPDVEQAITDGFSTAESLGVGLGAVNRLMDEFDITSEIGTHAGTKILCKRWLRINTPSLTSCHLDFGVASRPHALCTVNGDAFLIKRWQSSALVSVIDGLGHGENAHRAAEAARYYVESHFDQSLDHLFRGVERTCRATRGVVMALARFDCLGDRPTFTFGSVGNIETRMFGGQSAEHFLIRRGVLGSNAPMARVTQHKWERGSTLVLHSDGLSQRWTLESLR